jgi:hypothetical protein
MSRVRTLFATVLPSMIAGGLLFGSAPGHAESGRDSALGSWPAAPDTTGAVVAQADPRPRSRPWGPPVPPAPPVPGTYAVPPVPPVPPMPSRVHGHSRSHGHGMSVSIHDGKIEIDGLEELVQDQLERVGEILDNLPDVPPDVRDRVKTRVKSVRDKLGTRLGKLKSLDLDKIGPEMERMGDEIEKEMEGLDKDLERLGATFGKHFAEKFGRDFARSFGPSHSASSHDRDNSDAGDDDADAADDDDDDDKAATALPGVDSDLIDPSDLRAAIAGLKDLHLDQGQKDLLAKLRTDSERQISDAKRELEAMSNQLHDALGDAGASEADVARQIDQISAKEATIRKARILAWMKVRTMLDQDQRKKVEAAARRHH